MPPSSSDFRRNNFDLLRLVLAATVCFTHCYELSGYQQLAWITKVLSSATAVKAFFVISGFLIFMSFERSTSIYSYAEKRLRRVYPAYLTVVLLCALTLFSVSSKGVSDYFFSAAWLKYVLANSLFMNFIQPSLPGVFDMNRLHAVNGALWTLKIEVGFYLSVPVLVFLFRRFGTLLVIFAAYLGSVAWAAIFSWLDKRTGSQIYLELGRQLPGQLSYFVAGGLFYYHFSFFERWSRLLLCAAILVLIINSYWSVGALEPVALATTVMFLSMFPYLGNFGRHGDFSYGVYILHFPILQCLIGSGIFSDSPWLFLAAGASATLAGAVAMWHLVEKRFLLRTSHYVAASTPAGAQESRKTAAASHPNDILDEQGIR
jgi:peptidoglycan/LPS O-acetylase OafA/YrhL